MTKKIVIVDDESDARSYYITILEDLDLEFIEAEDGNVGMTAIRSERPDLVLLDLNMPNKGGIMVLHEINDDPELANIPVVIVSGHTLNTTSDLKKFYYGDSSDNEEDDSIGKKIDLMNLVFLKKPVAPEDLLTLVNSFVDL